MPRYDVRDWVDLFLVQRGVFHCADTLGFSRLASGELTIVASELASNILKYGVDGSVEAQPVEDDRGLGLALLASDRGPPFHDLGSALQDGWSDRGPIDPMDLTRRRGIGGGLGAIVRFTDSLRVEHRAEGKTIQVIRYRVRPPPRTR